MDEEKEEKNGGVDPPWKAVIVFVAALGLVGWLVSAGCQHCEVCPETPDWDPERKLR